MTCSPNPCELIFPHQSRFTCILSASCNMGPTAGIQNADWLTEFLLIGLIVDYMQRVSPRCLVVGLDTKMNRPNTVDFVNKATVHWENSKIYNRRTLWCRPNRLKVLGFRTPSTLTNLDVRIEKESNNGQHTNNTDHLRHLFILTPPLDVAPIHAHSMGHSML